MLATFVGEDKSMGLRYGQAYYIGIYFDVFNSMYWVKWCPTNKLDQIVSKLLDKSDSCPYSSLDLLKENWKQIYFESDATDPNSWEEIGIEKI